VRGVWGKVKGEILRLAALAQEDAVRARAKVKPEILNQVQDDEGQMQG